MRDLLESLLNQGTTLSPESIIMHIVVSAIIAIAIYVSYW